MDWLMIAGALGAGVLLGVCLTIGEAFRRIRSMESEVSAVRGIVSTNRGMIETLTRGMSRLASLADLHAPLRPPATDRPNGDKHPT